MELYSKQDPKVTSRYFKRQKQIKNITFPLVMDDECRQQLRITMAREFDSSGKLAYVRHIEVVFDNLLRSGAIRELTWGTFLT